MPPVPTGIGEGLQRRRITEKFAATWIRGSAVSSGPPQTQPWSAASRPSGVWLSRHEIEIVVPYERLSNTLQIGSEALGLKSFYCGRTRKLRNVNTDKLFI